MLSNDREVIEERVVLEEHPDALAYLLQLQLRGVGDAVVAHLRPCRGRAA